MKKLFLVSLMAFLTSVTMAQDVELPEEGAYLESGNLLIEITSSPFGRDDAYSSNALLNFGQFRARYALTEQLVPRLGLWFYVDDNQSGISTPDVTETITEFMVAPGIEYHFINENGFTSYAAFDVLVSRRTMEMQATNDFDVAGVIDNVSPASWGENRAFDFDERGFFGIGAQIAAGADYHFSSRFYIGAEIGFYAMSGKSSDVEVDGALYQQGISFFQAGVMTSNSFRIGFKLL